MTLWVVALDFLMTVFCRLQALLGMLGKLKRTLTQNLSEQKRITDDKGILLMTLRLPLPLCRATAALCMATPAASGPCNTAHLHTAGYIAAANLRSSVTEDVPNLLRPSPGLEFLSQDKLGLPTDQAVDRYMLACGNLQLQ